MGAQRFLRGQVWMVEEDFEISNRKRDIGDRTMAFTHPYLIVESNECLSSRDPIITCMPITSNIDKVFDNDIVIRNLDGEQKRLLVNNITSKDVRFFTSYMYTMSSDIMAAVDMQLTKRFGLTSALNMIATEVNDIEYSVANIKKFIVNKREELRKEKEEKEIEKIETDIKEDPVQPSYKRTKILMTIDQMIDFVNKYDNGEIKLLISQYNITEFQIRNKYRNAKYKLKKDGYI